MNRLQALRIARIAYKEIKQSMEKWDGDILEYLPIDFHWDGCITVADHFFKELELIDFKGDE